MTRMRGRGQGRGGGGRGAGAGDAWRKSTALKTRIAAPAKGDTLPDAVASAGTVTRKAEPARRHKSSAGVGRLTARRWLGAGAMSGCGPGVVELQWGHRV